MKRFVRLCLVAVLIISISLPLSCTVFADEVSDRYANCDFSSDALDILGVGAKKNKDICQVYLGGQALGLTIDGDGVTVIGLNEFVGDDGKLCCPALKAGLQINDVIVGLDGKKIYNSSKLSQIAVASSGKTLVVNYIRDGEAKTAEIVPQKDLASGSYRLGLWTRDSSGGIGTLTYVKKDLTFGSLGHPVCDSDGVITQCNRGGVYVCEPNDVLKGRRGAAGELRGQIDFERRLGCLNKNCKYGMYGQFTSLPSFCQQTIGVAEPTDVTPGSAEIFCTLPNLPTQSYKIEIVKTSYQNSCDEKGMVVHVVDERLLDVTGGIVQGMSGSPIVQNGRLVGAITHVFVNDPTRGYGIYAKWMLEQ